MNIEALLKLKCQQALAQGDYEAVTYYSEQLQLIDSGIALGALPIGDTLVRAKKFNRYWLDGNISYKDFETKLIALYGEDLTKVCLDFFYEFGGAELYDVIWSSKQ